MVRDAVEGKNAVDAAVFKDGDRWSWKDLECPNGDKRTSFYHWATRREAREAAFITLKANLPCNEVAAIINKEIEK